MSETTVDNYTDEQAEQDFELGTQEDDDFLAQLLVAFGAPQMDQALWERVDERVDVMNAFIDRVGFEGTGNTEGYHVHLSELQARWVISAIGEFICNAVPDNSNGAGDHLVDAADAILAAAQASV